MSAPTNDQLRALVKQGRAMPAPGQSRPGKFYIRNADDLQNAIGAVGRVQPPTDEARAQVRRFIMKCAAQMGLSNRIPDTWNADGTLKSGS